MLKSISPTLPALLWAGTMSLVLSGCETTKKPPLQPPSLSYKVAAVCTQTVSFDGAIRRTENEKKRKREMRHRMIDLNQEMANKHVPCLSNAAGQKIPYTAFVIPTGLEKRVVNAGSKFDEAVIFAAEVTTHDENGRLVRTFQDADYRRFGGVYGVQFSPRDTEKYVLIKADPTLVGAREETVETGTQNRYVSPYGAYPYGRRYRRNAYGNKYRDNYYGHSGTDKRGIQRSFIRTYSYNGQAAVQTVFPKQKTEK